MDGQLRMSHTIHYEPLQNLAMVRIIEDRL